MGMFDKKFRVRTRFFLEDYYTVEYCYYRFFPVWHPLLFWFDQGHPGGTEGWSEDMWGVEEAEKIAMSLKSIEDVNNYYKREEENERQWRLNEEAYQKTNIPYHSKEFT